MAIKKGLDLRGGIAFTMEANDLNESADTGDPSAGSAMDKVVEIMSERMNAFGVAETVVRKKGDRSIEIQIPDKTSKQNPEIIEELQKPAKLEFRIVYVGSEAPLSPTEGDMWTDDEDIPYVAMLRSDAEPNESPIWISGFGRRTVKSSKSLSQTGRAEGYEVGLDFTSEGGKIFGDLTGDIAQMADPDTELGRLAVILDRQLESAPPYRKGSMAEAVITGNFGYREAKCPHSWVLMRKPMPAAACYPRDQLYGSLVQGRWFSGSFFSLYQHPLGHRLASESFRQPSPFPGWPPSC